MAYLAAGDAGTARLLLEWTGHLRHDDGSWFTGMVHPQRHHFPVAERSTYSAAAVTLIAAAVDGTGPLVPLLTRSAGAKRTRRPL